MSGAMVQSPAVLKKSTGASNVGTSSGLTVEGALGARATFRDLSNDNNDLSMLIGDGKTVVIAGDSLSFNAFDFPVGLDPTNYAYLNSPGLMGWAHMLRDFIHRADINYIGADNCAVTKTGTAEVTVNDMSAGGTSYYYYPFNSRYLKINGKSQTDVVRVVVPRKSKSEIMRFHCVNTGADQEAKAGKVDVRVSYYPYTSFIDKGTITTGGRTNYFGLEPYFYDIGDAFTGAYPVLLEFYNFRTVADAVPTASGVQIIISAFSEKRTDVKLTGRGGYTSAQVLAEVGTMLSSHLPDVVALTLGSNDRALGVTSADFIDNFSAIVAAVRAGNPTCKIVYMCPPKANIEGFGFDEIINGETMGEWLSNVEAAVRSLNCFYFDWYNLFNNIDQGVWLFDDIHMTKAGGKITFDNFVAKYLGRSIGVQHIDLAEPTIKGQYVGGQTYNAAVRPAAGFEEYVFNFDTLSYLLVSNPSQSAVIKSVVRTSAYGFRVSTNYPVSYFSANGSGEGMPHIDLRCEFVGGSSSVLPSVIVAGVGEGYIDFSIIDLLVSPVSVVSDLKNGGKHYLIRWS